MPPRFFAPGLAPEGGIVILPEEEASHLARVLRLGVGDLVGVFDGRGNEQLARVESLGRRDVSLRTLGPKVPAPEPAVPITLAQAILKGDKMDSVVRDAAMIGVAVVQPVVTSRSESSLAALVRGNRVERWRRVAIQSVKQCGRAVIPEIRPACTLATLLRETATDARIIFVEPGASAESSPLGALEPLLVPSSATVLIGAEGGWSEDELEAARLQGFRFVTLGPRTLRADVAPVAAISVLQFLWGDM